MACTDCTPKVVYNYATPYSSTGCNGSTSSTDSASIVYNGATLTCASIPTGTALDVALQKIDTKLCAVLGDYSTYDTHCLTGITTEKQFVETITDNYCTLKSSYDTFTGTTYPADKTALTNSINTNNVPNITSSCTDVFNPVSTDTVKEVLQKVSNSICGIYNTTLDLSSVDWDNCYTVSDAPSTIQKGFTEVLTQICSLKTTVSSLAALPTFDNTSNCISGTATDTLEATVNSLTTLVCAAPTFNNSALTWGCYTKPSTGGANNLQDSFQVVLTAVNDLKKAMPVFSSDFISTPNGCAGTTVSLGTSVSDKYVAATSSDNTPGTLEDKLYAGDNITIDYASIPGKAKINATGGSSSVSDGKVKVSSSDTSADYLGNKISGVQGDDITISADVNQTNSSINLSASYNATALLTSLLNTLNDLPTSDPLFQLFCSIKNKCPESCGSVTDVTVNYYPSSTTTTTTTQA